MTPDLRRWISLGSEQEVAEECGGEAREKLLFKFSRVRRKFGTPVRFSDRNTAEAKDGFVECASYPDSRFSITRLQRDCGVQAVPRILSSSAQTEWKGLRSNAAQYTSRELSNEEKEGILQSDSLKDFCQVVTPRMLRALQQEEIMNVFVDDWMALGTGAPTVDSFGKVHQDLMIYQVFSVHMFIPDKKISCINWHPCIQGVIAVALTDTTEEQFTESKPSVILVYSFADPSKPQLLLECPDGILAFEFCPSDPNIIVGGCVNGQVVLWDISSHVTHLQCKLPAGHKTSINGDTFDLEDHSEKKTPLVHHCAVSALENSHKAPVTDVRWLPQTFEVTRTGIPMENKLQICVQLVTCSSDCSLLFWDVRTSKPAPLERKLHSDHRQQMTLSSAPDTFKHLDRTWKPLFKVSLPKIKKAGEYAPLKFSLDQYTCRDKSGSSPDASHGHDSLDAPVYSQLRMPSAKTLTPLEDVNTKMYIGTEDGEIVYTDWKLEKDDGGRLRSMKPLFCYDVHHCSVNTVQRSPFLNDVVLTGSSWNFAIWREGVGDGPLFLSPTSEHQCTTACWSPSRAAVFYIGRADGNIEVWNLLEKSSEPVQVYAHHTDSKITSIKPCTVSAKQHLLAVADDYGMVRVFEIPRKHCTPTRNEIGTVKKFLQLEEEKLKDLLKRRDVWSEEKKAVEDNKKKTFFLIGTRRSGERSTHWSRGKHGLQRVPVAGGENPEEPRAAADRRHRTRDTEPPPSRPRTLAFDFEELITFI
ncbi:dynein axonemal intermediate chain 3 [Neosynchiropus ocellatus]